MAVNNEYYMALGKFIHAFSQVEATFHFTFAPFAKIDQAVANAVKRQSNAGTLVTLIRNLLEVNDFSPADVKEFDSIANQFALISIFRDTAIHRGATLTEDGHFQSDNKATMRTVQALEIITFDLKHLECATLDLQCIAMRLFDLSDPASANPDPAAQAIWHAPWRYKAVQLKKPHQPPKQENKKRQRQQRA